MWRSWSSIFKRIKSDAEGPHKVAAGRLVEQGKLAHRKGKDGRDQYRIVKKGKPVKPPKKPTGKKGKPKPEEKPTPTEDRTGEPPWRAEWEATAEKAKKAGASEFADELRGTIRVFEKLWREKGSEPPEAMLLNADKDIKAELERNRRKAEAVKAEAARKKAEADAAAAKAKAEKDASDKLKKEAADRKRKEARDRKAAAGQLGPGGKLAEPSSRWTKVNQFVNWIKRMGGIKPGQTRYAEIPVALRNKKYGRSWEDYAEAMRDAGLFDDVGAAKEWLQEAAVNPTGVKLPRKGGEVGESEHAASSLMQGAEPSLKKLVDTHPRLQRLIADLAQKMLDREIAKGRLETATTVGDDRAIKAVIDKLGKAVDKGWAEVGKHYGKTDRDRLRAQLDSTLSIGGREADIESSAKPKLTDDITRLRKKVEQHSERVLKLEEKQIGLAEVGRRMSKKEVASLERSRALLEEVSRELRVAYEDAGFDPDYDAELHAIRDPKWTKSKVGTVPGESLVGKTVEVLKIRGRVIEQKQRNGKWQVRVEYNAPGVRKKSRSWVPYNSVRVIDEGQMDRALPGMDDLAGDTERMKAVEKAERDAKKQVKDLPLFGERTEEALAKEEADLVKRESSKRQKGLFDIDNIKRSRIGSSRLTGDKAPRKSKAQAKREVTLRDARARAHEKQLIKEAKRYGLTVPDELRREKAESSVAKQLAKFGKEAEREAVVLLLKDGRRIAAPGEADKVDVGKLLSENGLTLDDVVTFIHNHPEVQNPSRRFLDYFPSWSDATHSVGMGARPRSDVSVGLIVGPGGSMTLFQFSAPKGSGRAGIKRLAQMYQKALTSSSTGRIALNTANSFKGVRIVRDPSVRDITLAFGKNLLRAIDKAGIELGAAEKAAVAAKKAAKKKKPPTEFAKAAVEIPPEGLDLADAERAALMKDLYKPSDLDEAKARLLGRTGAYDTAEEFGKLKEGERLVHLARRVRSAKHPKEIDNIMAAEKYRISELSPDAFKALAVAVASRFGGKADQYPDRLASAFKDLEKGNARDSGGRQLVPGVAGGRPTWQDIWKSMVKGHGILTPLLPVRTVLRHTPLPDMFRKASEQVKIEWNYWSGLVGRTRVFGDANGVPIKEKSRDSAIVDRLLEDGLDLNEVTFKGTRKGWKRKNRYTEGEVAKVELYHKRIASTLRDAYDDLFQRQGVEPVDSRRAARAKAKGQEPPPGPSRGRYRKDYSPSIREAHDRMFDLTPAEQKLIDRIVKLAEESFGSKFDKTSVDDPISPRSHLRNTISAGLTRNKALQILDYLRSRQPKTAKAMKRNIDIILGYDERAMVPDELWQPHLKERTGEAFVNEDAVGKFSAYLRYSLRKIHLEPMAREAAPVIEAMQGKGDPLSVRTYCEQVVGHILGQKSKADVSLDARLESLAIATGKMAELNVPIVRALFKGAHWAAKKAARPKAATRWTSALNRYQYYRLLALALDSAASNAAQGVNTWSYFSGGPTAVGYARLISQSPQVLARKLIPGAKRFVKEPRFQRAHLMQEFEQFLTGPRPFYAQGLRPFESLLLTPFRMIEALNRGAAFEAGMYRAKKLGLSKKRSVRLGKGEPSRFIADADPETYRDVFYTSEAEWFAKKGVIETQFGYSPAESAPLFSTPTGRLFLQFWNFPTQQSAFMLDGIQGKLKHSTNPAEKAGWSRMRFLMLAGWMYAVASPLMEWMYGLDVKNLWSIRGVMPRGPGPNIQLALYLGQAMGGDWAAKQKLQQDYGTQTTPGGTDVQLAGTWVPRGLRKATGMSHRTLPEGSPFRFLPVRPTYEKELKSGRSGRRGRSGRSGR
jgi:hypothetical protein